MIKKKSLLLLLMKTNPLCAIFLTGKFENYVNIRILRPVNKHLQCVELIPFKQSAKLSKNLIVMDRELGKFDTIPSSSLELSASMDDVTRKSPRRFLVSEC